jgi:hypothetical protein
LKGLPGDWRGKVQWIYVVLGALLLDDNELGQPSLVGFFVNVVVLGHDV